MSAVPPPDDNERTVMPGLPAAGAAGSGNALPVGTRLSEFEIIGLVGEGGFGIVYLAHDHSLQRNVALKEYMPSALAARTAGMTVAVKSERHAETFQAGLKSFINEARLLARFDHSSLVKVYRFWEANGTAYMAMPFYEGATLSEALRRLGEPPDEAWIRDLLRPLLDALDLIHSEQCFHRDIAPDNILILKDGRPLLLDFGAARRVIGDMTHVLTVILKPGYAPVEQYADAPHMKQGAWTDIYALASVVYFAIVGRAPVPSVARLMSDPLQPLAELAAGRYSEDFLRAIDKALAVKPEDRPQSIAELRTLLGLADRRQTVRTPVPKVAAAGSGPSKRERLPMALYASVAALIVVAAGTGTFFLLHSRPAQTPRVAPWQAVTATTQAPAAIQAPGPNMGRSPPSKTTPTMAESSAQGEAKVFDPVHALDEVFEGRDLNHAVTVAVKNPRLRINRDALSFGVASSQPGYVYILMVSAENEDFFLLFPNRRDQSNRIEPGRPLDLPRPSWRIVAGGPAGTDHLAAIVSDAPRDFTSAGLQAKGDYAQFPLAEAAARYRAYTGAGALFAGVPKCSPGEACSTAYGVSVFSVEEISR